MSIRRLPSLVVLIVSCTSLACTQGGDAPDPTPATNSIDTSTFAAQVASTDMAAGRDERVQVGVVSSTQDAGVQLLSYGSVQLSFAFLGTDGSGEPQEGPATSATYLPAPGTDDAGTEPTLTNPADARGVYQAEGIVFEDAGVWRATVSADVAGMGPLKLESNFVVKVGSTLPAPGDRALRTENLTMDSKGVEPVAIDSRAQGDEPVPDPELHRWTIAEAIGQHRPALVLFSTPVYCLSQFCGPDAEALAQLAKDYPDRAVFIHIEIWNLNTPDEKIANEAAADWLYRDGDLTEPWLYLIGADGKIADRWGPLFDPAQVGATLDALPPMEQG
ncbi:MAG TPA: hypothetical protein VI341_12360 [Actinomycetota bacterium]